MRWLPRHRAWDLLLPGSDLWISDGRLMRVHHFSGDGEWVSKELCDDPDLVGRHAAAFERVWERAIPHDRYEVK